MEAHMTEEARISKAVTDVVEHTQRFGYKRATKYLSPKLTVKAARQHRPRRNERSVTVVVTIGRPNYVERTFISQCKKAGVPFPVRKTQLRLWPIKQR